jgi:hypothetical protein
MEFATYSALQGYPVAGKRNSGRNDGLELKTLYGEFITYSSHEHGITALRSIPVVGIAHFAINIMLEDALLLKRIKCRHDHRDFVVLVWLSKISSYLFVKVLTSTLVIRLRFTLNSCRSISVSLLDVSLRLPMPILDSVSSILNLNYSTFLVISFIFSSIF